MKALDTPRPGERRFFIVADDLTGACDSAVAFAQRGVTVEVLLEGEAKASGDGVWAISTESRDLPEDLAVRRVREGLMGAGERCEVFKKIDSVFRGNSFSEIRGALDCFPCDLAVMSPAYPLMGRSVRDGVLSIAGDGHDRTIDLRDGLRGAGISDFSLLRTGNSLEAIKAMQDAVKAGCRLVLCDAESEEDLRSVVAAARSLGKRNLWVGSGGLAHALAFYLPVSEPRQDEEALDGRVVLFVGSDHAVTRRQMEALRQSFPVHEVSVEEFSTPPLEAKVVILNVSRNSTVDAEIRRVIADLAPQGIGCCLLTGGDTAALVCRALRVRSLRLTKEFAPGLPQGKVVGGPLDGIPVILKSGGFGKEDVLCGVVHRFSSRREFV